MGEIDWSRGSAEMLDSDLVIYPDWISGVSQTIISESVLEDLREHGMTGFKAHLLRTLEVSSAQLQLLPKPWPRYYLLEVTGKVNYDRHYYDENEGSTCSLCGRYFPKSDGKYRIPGAYDSRGVPEEGSWSGDDLVRSCNIRTGYLYVSRRLVDLGLERKWSKFAVGSFDGRWVLPLEKDNWFEDYERLFDEHIVPEYQKLPQTETLRNTCPEESR